MKKVIITGVSGQDGSYMADYLLEQTGHEIYGVVRRTAKPDYSNIKLALENPRFHLITGDLSDSNSIDNVVREVQPDYFLNFAAQSFVGDSWKLPEQTFDSVAVGVLRCLEAIRKLAPQCRFYSAGSSEEMGDVVYSPQDINHPIRPRSPYGAAKAAARHLTKVYRDSYGLYAVHCILYNHESERRGVEFVTRKITQNVARIKYAIANGKSFDPMELGNVNAKRDWSHAKDFVRGIWFIMNQEHPKDYILASGKAHSIREFVEKAFAAAGITGYWRGEGVHEEFIVTDCLIDESCSHRWTFNREIIVGVQINSKFYRPAEVDLLLGNSSEVRRDIGWAPMISFDNLVKGMVTNDIKLYNREASIPPIS